MPTQAGVLAPAPDGSGSFTFATTLAALPRRLKRLVGLRVYPRSRLVLTRVVRLQRGVSIAVSARQRGVDAGGESRFRGGVLPDHS